uniref:NADH-ubiquinone oxidoreductase chain 5 n=1 Tax=Pseudognaptodon sp. QL-2014 TaxID=1491725 RepID=A0A0U1WH30_9HYME|nr:NADH dehydrogenase subunit 5 [Pseudognaptodon sp. QL-2014]
MFFLISLYLFLLNFLRWLMFLMFLMFNNKIFIEWVIFLFNSFKIEFIMYFDWMSMIFFSTVLLISSMVLIYSLNYMEGDLNLKRFMILILIFVLSMILMILSPNMISILLGWDGLGLSSYCLVAYYLSKKSFNSSMITILMNRIGDIMILLMIALFMTFGSWNIMFLKNINILIMFLIMMASITKSAQIPFSSWLPLAMAAPTPVSSLVHSSTLVTAGVYLIIRFYYLMNNNFLYFLMMLSCFTMLLAGYSAISEFDLKKIIALSTLSQLGLMISTISLNLPKLAFLHLINHAMFKSLLFLCSGILIHFYFNHQDIRFMSLMNLNLPLINLIFNIASFTLCGMPFLTGFYSKDLIIEMFLMNKFNLIIFIFMFFSMMFTIMYSFRLMFYLSFKQKKNHIFNFYNLNNLMNYSIYILLLLSIFYGSILNWLMFSSINLIFLPKKMKLLIYLFLIIGLMLGIKIPLLKIKIFKNYLIYKKFIFLNSMWYYLLMFKKNKNNLILLNNNFLMINDSSWLENITFKKYFFYMYLFMKNKNIYKLNFFLMMFMILYMIFLILYF